MWAMMQKFRICAGAVKVWSAKLLMGISWSGFFAGACERFQGIETAPGQHNHQSARSPMLGNMASPWKTLQRRLGQAAGNVVFNEAPKFIRQIQNSPTLQRGIQQGIKLGLEAITGSSSEAAAAAAISAGRPVTEGSVPTAYRARKLSYAPDLDGRADPGEIVWTWVVYEDDPTRGKDRPVLVVGRDNNTLLGLLLSSQDHHAGDPQWIGIGQGSWDPEGRTSWVRLDRVLDVPEESIRREGAILDRTVFDIVATRLRAEYSWS
jgi:PemK-like, MazF-like toxin of type II toxin-antitoxin system